MLPLYDAILIRLVWSRAGIVDSMIRGAVHYNVRKLGASICSDLSNRRVELSEHSSLEVSKTTVDLCCLLGLESVRLRVSSVIVYNE